MGEETKVRRSGPGIKPAVGMVCSLFSDGGDITLDSFNVMELSTSATWREGGWFIKHTPSPDPGEAPGCKGKPCGMNPEAITAWKPGADRSGWFFTAAYQNTGMSFDGRFYCSVACRERAEAKPASPTPADPRDVAIARWPWMAPFRDVKVGDRFAVHGRAEPVTVLATVWEGDGARFDMNGCVVFRMSDKHRWALLTPYREAKPVEAKYPAQARMDALDLVMNNMYWAATKPHESNPVPQAKPVGASLGAVAVDEIAGIDDASIAAVYAYMNSVQAEAYKLAGIDWGKQEKPKPSPWTCSNGKECRTPGAPEWHPRGRAKWGAIRWCVVCVDRLEASSTAELDKARASERAAQPKPRPQPGYTMPGEHAQLALKGGWRRGWR